MEDQSLRASRGRDHSKAHGHGGQGQSGKKEEVSRHSTGKKKHKKHPSEKKDAKEEDPGISTGEPHHAREPSSDDDDSDDVKVVLLGKIVRRIFEQDRMAKLVFMLAYLSLAILIMCIFAAGTSPDWLNNLRQIENEVFWDNDLELVHDYHTTVDFVENQLDAVLDISQSAQPDRGLFFNYHNQLVEVLFIMDCDATQDAPDKCREAMHDLGLGHLRRSDFDDAAKGAYLIYSGLQTPNSTNQSRALAPKIAGVLRDNPDHFSDPNLYFSFWNDEEEYGSTLKLEFNFQREYGKPFLSRISRTPDVNTEYENIRDHKFGNHSFRDSLTLLLIGLLMIFTVSLANDEYEKYVLCRRWQENVESKSKEPVERSFFSLAEYNWWNITTIVHLTFAIVGMCIINPTLVVVSMNNVQDIDWDDLGTVNGLFQANEAHHLINSSNLERIATFINVVFCISCLLQVLRCMRFHPGVAVLTRTMYLARHEIVDVVFVMMVVMITFWAVLYGIAGLTAVHEDFVLPSRAFSSLSLMAFGFFEFDRWMNEEHGRQFDGLGVNDGSGAKELLFWVIVFLIMIVVPNILLAVILGAYERAVSEESEAGVVYKERINVFQVFWRHAYSSLLDMRHVFASRPSCQLMVHLACDENNEPRHLSRHKKYALQSRFCRTDEAYFMMNHFIFPWTGRLLLPDSYNDELMPPPEVLLNTKMLSDHELSSATHGFENSWLWGDKSAAVASQTVMDLASIMFSLWHESKAQILANIDDPRAKEHAHRKKFAHALHKVQRSSHQTSQSVDYLHRKMNELMRCLEVDVPPEAHQKHQKHRRSPSHRSESSGEASSAKHAVQSQSLTEVEHEDSDGEGDQRHPAHGHDHKETAAHSADRSTKRSPARHRPQAPVSSASADAVRRNQQELQEGPSQRPSLFRGDTEGSGCRQS